MAKGTRKDLNHTMANEETVIIPSGKQLMRDLDLLKAEYDERDQKAKAKQDAAEYKAFFDTIHKLWASSAVEEQMVRTDGEAFIVGDMHDLSISASSRLAREEQRSLFRRQSKEVSANIVPCAHKIMSGHDYFQCSYADKEQYDLITRKEFGLSYDHLCKFMDLHDYEFELGIFAYRTEYPSYFEPVVSLLDILPAIYYMIRKEYVIVSFQYVLKIRCKC